MNRRKALSRILLAGIGGTLAFGGYKWYDWNKTPDLAWLDRKKDLLAALADTIIPPTEDPASAKHIPGASESGAPSFYMLVLLKDCTRPENPQSFHRRPQRSRSPLSRNLSVLFYPMPPKRPDKKSSPGSKKKTNLYKVSGVRAEGRYLGKPFFITLKEYTVQAYCSSEMGATRGLDYVPVPGSYHGCIPLQPDTPAWATK